MILLLKQEISYSLPPRRQHSKLCTPTGGKSLSHVDREGARIFAKKLFG